MSSRADDDVQELIAHCRLKGRICPQPNQWHDLWLVLVEHAEAADGQPPKPLILGAWWETSDADKQGRFREHLDWAEQVDCLVHVLTFLEALEEADWHHVGD